MDSVRNDTKEEGVNNVETVDRGEQKRTCAVLKLWDCYKDGVVQCIKVTFLFFGAYSA